MSDFTAGFAARHEAAADALHAAFSIPSGGFAPADMRARAGASTGGPVSFAPQGFGPRHFSPADRSADPTEGWDPLTAADAGSAVDRTATAHAAGYAEGMATAMAEMGANLERDRALLTQLGEALGADKRFDRERMARQLRQTVMFLVTRLVGEVGIAPDILARRIEAASELLAGAAESAMLRVHPDDVALLDGKLPSTIFPIGDAAVARGGFVLESSSTIVEDGPELWLEQLANAIDRIAMPPAC